MREFPKGGLIGKTVHLWRRLRQLRIPLYAANASFFIVLAFFPGLLFLLGLLRYTPLEVERLGELLTGILPEALLEGAEELILLTYDATSAYTLGLSSVTTLWSASRSVYGLLTGLNFVYGIEENRSWLRIRLVSMGYTFALFLVLVLTLGLQVFGTGVISLLKRAGHPFVQFLLELIDLRFFLLLSLQTSVFTAIFMALPSGRNSFHDSIPGALLASLGWLTFSNLYSLYVAHFAHLWNIYGSVYAIALSMLWLYCCMAILFYGGALNRFLSEHQPSA